MSSPTKSSTCIPYSQMFFNFFPRKITSVLDSHRSTNTFHDNLRKPVPDFLVFMYPSFSSTVISSGRKIL